MITDLRRELAADLKEVGVPVQEAWPASPAIPGLIVVPGSPSYVTGGQTFGQFVVHVDVLCLVVRDRQALVRLDALLEGVLANSVDWALVGVEPPALVAVGSQQVLGSTVSLAKAGSI